MGKITVKFMGVSDVRTAVKFDKVTEAIRSKISFECEANPYELARLTNLLKRRCQLDVEICTPQCDLDLMLQGVRTDTGEVVERL